MLGTLTLLALAARSQMQFQYAPTDLKYPPAQPVPAARRDRMPKPSDIGDIDDDDEDDDGPAYTPTLAPTYGQPANPSFSPTFTPSTTVTPPPPQQRPQPAPRAETAAPRTAAPAPRPAAPPLKKVAETPEPAPKVGGFRRVGNKVFKQMDDGFLTDTAYRADANLETVEVRAGSADYSRLIAEHRDLARYFRLSDQLVVVFENVVYRVVP